MIERLNAPPKTEEKKELKNYVIWAELNEAEMMADGPMDANNTTQAVCWRRRQTSAHINHPLLICGSTTWSHLLAAHQSSSSESTIIWPISPSEQFLSLRLISALHSLQF